MQDVAKATAAKAKAFADRKQLNLRGMGNHPATPRKANPQPFANVNWDRWASDPEYAARVDAASAPMIKASKALAAPPKIEKAEVAAPAQHHPYIPIDPTLAKPIGFVVKNQLQPA